MPNNNGSPAFRDKEERRLIIIDSLNGLLKLIDVEKQEKYNSMKLLLMAVTGGVGLIGWSTQNTLQQNIALAFIEVIVIGSILALNYTIINKLISGRIASNEIFNEYGSRLRYLIETHLSDISFVPKEEAVSGAFKRYYSYKVKRGLGNADKKEIYAFMFINVLFSFILMIPLITFAGFEIQKINSAYSLTYIFHNKDFLAWFIVFIVFEAVFVYLNIDVIKRAQDKLNIDQAELFKNRKIFFKMLSNQQNI